MCVCERESVCVCVCVYVCGRGRERMCHCVCACVTVCHLLCASKKVLKNDCLAFKLYMPVFQFMKFVKKIGDGEITIEDNQVVEKSTDERAEDWVSDFRTAEVKIS